ncbi:MAG TPA: nucleotidyltransferase domain-containing protein [Chitinophagaceae bacterium]|nr:nucleotidyltransferase domain-containing protein [Chitinophagaceae bacterium]
MVLNPVFPTVLHRDAAELVQAYFISLPIIDTVLVVNSCARGLAVPESDLDFAILVKPGTSKNKIENAEADWNIYSNNHQAISEYKTFSPYAHLHLDIIDGNYTPTRIENGEPIDYFEVEIGNQICYSAPIGNAGEYFLELQSKWLPFYNDELQEQRLKASINACEYDLIHIPFFVKRELYFQAFDILCKAFQEYLRTLFIAKKIYPIAYNKWIKEQVVKWLNMPGLYPKLSPILSVTNIESNEINAKAILLRELLDDLSNEK